MNGREGPKGNDADIDPVNGPIPQRWTAKRKAAIVLEIIKGKTTAAEVTRQNSLTVADVEGWIERAQFGMEEFLKALPKEGEEWHSRRSVGQAARVGCKWCEIRACA